MQALSSFCEYTRSVRQAVKSSRGATLLGRAVVVLGVALSRASGASPLDPALPAGAEQVGRLRPDFSEAAACSFRQPVCVHRAPAVPAARALAWLGLLEAAHARLVWVMGLPAPISDVARGGSAALDFYVSGSEELTVSPDAKEPSRVGDHAPGFCVAGAMEAPSARAATFCVAEAIALRLDASETPFSRRALATSLWFATSPLGPDDIARIDDVQAHPERAIIARERSPLAEGAALFPAFLGNAREAALGADTALATFALSGWGGSDAGFRYVNEPDTLDVLRATFGPKPSDVAALFGDFSIARALLGRGGEGPWLEPLSAGDFGRVRFEWSIPFSSLPRRLAPSRPVEPTGATFLWIDIDGDPRGATLAMRAQWEPPAAFRWELAVFDGHGRVLRRVDVPFLERESSVERTIADLSGARGVLIAGTNLGGLGPSYPFDPDFEPYEPHSYDVYLVRQ